MGYLAHPIIGSGVQTEHGGLEVQGHRPFSHLPQHLHRLFPRAATACYLIVHLSIGAVDGDTQLSEPHAGQTAYLLAAVERQGVGEQAHSQIALVQIVENVGDS